MSKGQNLVVSAIVMILIVITVVAGILMFGTDLLDDVFRAGEERTEEFIEEAGSGIAIRHVYTEERKVEIVNIGDVSISSESFRIFLDGELAEHETEYCDRLLQPGDRCNLTLDDPY